MERLTKKEPQGNFETLMNYAYAKEGKACLRYAGGMQDVPLHEYASNQCRKHGCEMSSDLIFEEGLSDCPHCDVAIMYYLGCQAAENNARLMKHEDLEENNEPLTLEQLKQMAGNPVWIELIIAKTGVWKIMNDFTERAILFKCDYAMFAESYGTVWVAYKRKPNN